MTTKVFCLILNYNRPEDTVKCATALLDSKLPINTEIIVIDNGKKNLKSYFSKQIEKLIYIKSSGNIGFAAGNNQGIKYALGHGATHVLIINPDVTVPNNFLLPLLSTLNKLPKKCGLIAPAHTEGRGSYGLGGKIDWNWCSFPHDNVKMLPTKPIKYDLLTFACVLVKREVFERVGLMDERYFLYLEDVDYCISAKQAGFVLYLDPSVIVTHITSSSFDDPRGKIKFSFNSSLIFINKWYKFPRNILPILNTIYFYPKLYVLWTLKAWKRQILGLFKIKFKENSTSIVKSTPLKNIKLYIYNALPSGGGKNIYQININYLKGIYKSIQIFEENFLPVNFLSYMYYLIFTSKHLAKSFSSHIDKEKAVMIVYHSWFLKSPHILRYSQIPTIYICNEPPREFYDIEHIKTQSIKEKIINLLRLPVKYIDKINAKSATIIVANSNYSKLMINSAYNRDALVIYPGLPSTKFRKLKKLNQIITIGAINKLKRQLFYVEVISKIEKKLRPTLIIICNGIDTEYQSKILDSAKKNCVSVKILVNITHSKLIDEISKSKAFIYAPINEPFGLVILEALSQGLPIIYFTHGGGFVEILNSKSGYGIDSLDIQTWAKYLAKILDFSKEKIESIKNNNVSISKAYNDIRMNKELTNIINRL